MRKTRLLTLLLLLMTAVTGAWANDYLYLEVSGESATLKYGEDYSGKPYYDERAEWWTSDSESWNGKGTIKTITVDASCQNINYSNLSALFFDFSGLEAINNAGNLNTSKVQDMSRMFVNCSSFTKLDLSGWDTSKVTDMLSMFDGCLALTALNISGWNTGELTNTQSMFENCVNLKFIYVGAGWSTTKVTNGVGMFYGCGNLPNWDPAKTDVSNAYVGDGGYLTSNMKTIYCKMEYGWWTDGNAAIGIYAWGDNNQKNAEWPGERMTLADGETNIWKFDLDVATYKNCIFTRVNPSGDIADWGAKTVDLTIPTGDDDMFTITNTTEIWGDPGCEGTWSKYIAPKFILTGSMSNWEEKIKVYDDSYVLDLDAGTYKIKVIDGENWKGFTDLTEVSDNLYFDNQNNICFKLGEAGNVTVTYISGETFTVVGNFVAPTVALAGSMNEWSTTANVFTTAADQKTASMTINLATVGDYEFKIVVDENWLSKEGEGGSKYSLHRGWRTVDGVDQFNKPNFKLTTDVAGDYTFTWTYATNTLTITFPTGDLTLDEVADNAETLTNWDGTSANLTLKRTLTTGGWNTFAVPFDVSSTMLTTLKTTYGVTVKKLTDASFADGTLTLTFGDAESIEAGKPYIVNVTSNFDFSEILIPGVIISKTAKPFTSTNVDFIPTLGKTTIEGETKEILIMAGGGELKHPKTLPADIKGFRAYFQLKGDAANAASFNLDFGNGETTGINNLNVNDNDNLDNATPMYNTAGQRVNKSYKGIVIVNGKKMVIK